MEHQLFINEIRIINLDIIEQNQIIINIPNYLYINLNKDEINENIY